MRWEYFDEFIPAIENVLKVPMVDDLVNTVLTGISKGRKNSGGVRRNGPALSGKAARLEAFKKLKEQTDGRE